jgi:hypothetical protein
VAQALSAGATALRDFVIVPRLRLRQLAALVWCLRRHQAATAPRRAVSGVVGLVWVEMEEIEEILRRWRVLRV